MMYECQPDSTAPAGWSLDQAAQSLIGRQETGVWRWGFTGRCLLRPGYPLHATDILRLLAPGLAALGAEVRFEEMPCRTARLETALHRLRQRGRSITLLRFESERTGSGDPLDEDPEIRNGRNLVRCGLLTGEALVLSHGSEAAWQCVTAPCDAPVNLAGANLRRSFTHFAWFVRSRHRGVRRNAVRLALLRWLAFLCARPDRSRIGSGAAAFLLAAAGHRRDRPAQLLRSAAQRLGSAQSQAEIAAGLAFLREGVIRDLRLPALAQSALLQPHDTELTPLQRREMIYLARAGTPDIRVICAQRLAPEWRHSDVLATLSSLQETGDLWLKQAAVLER
ncbi:MAG: hypothetical protein KGJ62_00225 [Armatimonadetes bacterium]|nr:hypothetical protein [Armatimonadota bacterium]MDE2206049.1 hypothetical protein [Armatimonadota bacterium]